MNVVIRVIGRHRVEVIEVKQLFIRFPHNSKSCPNSFLQKPGVLQVSPNACCGYIEAVLWESRYLEITKKTTTIALLEQNIRMIGNWQKSCLRGCFSSLFPTGLKQVYNRRRRRRLRYLEVHGDRRLRSVFFSKEMSNTSRPMDQQLSEVKMIGLYVGEQ